MSGENVTRLPCPTCTGPGRQTVGMVCPTCGTDYGTTAGDELTAQLAEALVMSRNRQMDAAALLPVVRWYGDHRAAEELRAAAQALDDSISASRLYARATALCGEARR